MRSSCDHKPTVLSLLVLEWSISAVFGTRDVLNSALPPPLILVHMVEVVFKVVAAEQIYAQ